MNERYILVSDDEYCYTLDTLTKNYKTLEDFEKQEFENAKKDNVDIKEYEDEILSLASDKYWDWVYNNHLEADTVNDILNCLVDKNEQLKKENVYLKEEMRSLKVDLENIDLFEERKVKYSEFWVEKLKKIVGDNDD